MLENNLKLYRNQIEIKVNMASDRLDPDRHLKRLLKVVNVTKKIQDLAESKIQHNVSPENKALEAKLIEEAKKKRKERTNSLDASHMYILDIVASLIGISSDEAIEGIVDSDEHVKLLLSLVAAKGKKSVIFSYNLFNHPPKGKLKPFSTSILLGNASDFICSF